jgi:hypothetical protein
VSAAGSSSRSDVVDTNIVMHAEQKREGDTTETTVKITPIEEKKRIEGDSPDR